MAHDDLQREKITFGVRVPNSGPLASPAAIAQVAQEAERFGFDSVWVHDHLTWTEEIHRTHISSGSDEAIQTNDKPDFYEAVTTLSYLAGLVNSEICDSAGLMMSRSLSHWSTRGFEKRYWRPMREAGTFFWRIRP